MKTFDDLEFKDHMITADLESIRRNDELYGRMVEFCNQNGKPEHAVMEFPNGYGVSVLRGGPFYTENGTYELGVLHNGALTYDTPISDDVLGRLSREEVTEVMRKVQEL